MLDGFETDSLITGWEDLHNITNGSIHNSYHVRDGSLEFQMYQLIR